MNKSAIQRFAIWARTELIAQVSQRAYQYGITKDGYGEANAVTVGGRALSTDEQRQRKELVQQIQQKDYTQVMEEVAYTWFNRFIALRFMEVNNYLPSHIRVFSDSTGAFKPEILNDVLHLELPGLNADKVAEYIENNQTNDLYRYLLLTQCNALNEALPRMFERMGGYTELLLPNNILKQDGILGRMVTDIPEEDWTDQVQIIGWLYQFYNTELKAEVFGKSGKIAKNEIPAATQLFTPDWIVRYMVENSLGRIFIDKRKNEGVFADGRGADEMPWEESEAKRIANEKYIAEQMGWKYYLPEAEQTQEVRQHLDEIQNEYTSLNMKEIKVIDPCMGSGHILVYAFDVLMQIYAASGYSQRDAAQSILENNLFGLDIDDRAALLAYFAVMMKARQYDRRIFSRGIQPHVYAIVESNGLDSSTVDYFTNNDPNLQKDFATLREELRDAKEYGSILNISQVDFAALYARVEEVRNDISLFREMVLDAILPLILVAEVMAQKYDVVITNPPYLGNGSVKLTEYLQKNYAAEKYDLYAAFIKKGWSFLKPHGYEAMVTGESWMFLPSFADMRQSITQSRTILNMAHLGFGAFDGGFGTTAFVFAKEFVPSYSSSFVRLVGIKDAKEKSEQLSSARRKPIVFQQKEFEIIEGYPFAYWMNRNVLDSFKRPPLSQYAVTKAGIVTGNNDFFMKLWHEVLFAEIELNTKCGDDFPKWVPAHKGGGNCRYYGNFDYVMRLSDLWNPGLAQANMRRGDPNYYFLEGLTWSTLSNKLALRYSPSGFVYETKGSMCFAKANTSLFYMLGLLNSSLCDYVMSILSPTLDFNRGSLLKMPYVEDQNKMRSIEKTVKECIELAKEDWDSFETSWDFKQHPMVALAHITTYKSNGTASYRIEDAYSWWQNECGTRFATLKTNEEELNRIFIDIYGLQNELTPEVADKDITVHRIFDSKDDVPESMHGSAYVRTMRDEIVSLISYAVGCMFGRYSLDVDGLAYAGGDWDDSKYSTFQPDADNIIPICDDEYFDDDITGRFVKWVETVYGKETLEENLKYIADALGAGRSGASKGTPREVIRSYFLNDFYADHLKIYQKRPIYWLFDSGKKNGFKALIYMHRYQSDLLARMRTDYVHEQQERYRTQLMHIANAIDHASATERVKLTKQQKKIQDQALEIQKYEEKIHHLADQNISIDLDDGVKHNYELFADVLVKIK